MRFSDFLCIPRKWNFIFNYVFNQNDHIFYVIGSQANGGEFIQILLIPQVQSSQVSTKSLDCEQ